MNRSVFFISDGTGITAETLGHSLLAQFGGLKFDQFTLPYVDSPERAHDAVKKINAVAAEDGLLGFLDHEAVERRATLDGGQV